MANLLQFEGRPNIAGSVPSAVVDEGALGRSLAETGAALGAQLGKMADKAAASEGEIAGLNAGARAGAHFVERQSSIRAAASRSAPAPKERGVPAGPETPQLNDAPLQLRHDNTIRGEAFDDAARSAYAWRLDTGLTTDLGQAAIANQDSPQGYEAAIGKIRSKYLSDAGLADPKLREVFDKGFAERVASDRLQLMARQEARMKAAASDAATAAIDTRATDLERQAYNLGANPAAEWILGGQLTRHLTAIDHAVTGGALTRTQGAAAKSTAENAVARGRISGVFAALDSPAKKESYALGLMDQWAGGHGSIARLGMEQVKALSAELFSQARAETNAQTAALKGQSAQYETMIVDDVAQMEATGHGLDFSKQGINVADMTTALGPEKAAKWAAQRDDARALWDATNGMELETPDELAARLAALKPKEGDSNFAGRQAAYVAAGKKATDLLAERKSDPLGQASRGGLVNLLPIDTSSSEALTDSLKLRGQAAVTVSRTYGTPVTVFRPEEAAQLTTALADNPGLIPTLARTMNAALGPLAPRALGELSDAGPALSYAAGLELATGDGSVAADIARTLGNRKDPAFKGAKMPSDGDLGDAAGALLGETFAHNDKARSAVIGTANLLFEKDANALGFDPSGVKKPGNVAAAAYQRALDRALGGKTVNGVKYGGMAEVNGAPIVAPPDLPADRPEQLIRQFRQTDFAFLPPTQSANGLPITASDMQGAHLVTIGNGQYRVALGDPQGLDPRYVAAKDGGFWVLDIGTLDRLHRMPGEISNAPFGIDFGAPPGADRP